MNFVDKIIECKSKSDVFYVYPLGDIHIGAFNCAEGHLQGFIDYIKAKERAMWFGGGDYCNCILPSDTRRYDVGAMADWIFAGGALSVKEALMDIAKQERDRFCEMVEPISEKCLGLLLGNHEADLMKRAHNGHHYLMCEDMGVPNLTDCAFIRLRFRRHGSVSRVITIFTMHGCGGGRTPGAEPNHLMRMKQIADADIYLRGHSHTFRIEPSEPHLYIPKSGALPDECYQRELFSGNWGTWLKSYAKGASTYDSMKAYPPRPLKAIEIAIKPFHDYTATVCGRKTQRSRAIITMHECPFEFEKGGD